MDQVFERLLRGRRVRLLVKDPREYLQSHWARGEIYEYDLYGADPVRRAAGRLVSSLSRRVRGHDRVGMLRWISERYRGGTFLDVGSCIGNHTLFFSVACEADLVVSFEPVPELFAHQREVIDLNALENVELVNAAVGDHEGTVRFQRAARGNAGMGRVSEGGSSGGGLDVRVTTVDAVLEGRDVPPVRLVKLDVEGYNVPALRGARATLERHKPDVFVECETKAALYDAERELGAMGFSRRTDVVFNKTPTYLFVPRVVSAKKT
jgi:FkbM family methyltransferase